MSHRNPLSLLYSVRYRRAVLLPLTSLVSHRKPLSLLYSVRYRRAVSLPLTSLVSHRKSLSLTLPPAAVELISPTGGGRLLVLCSFVSSPIPLATPFKISAVLRLHSHLLFFTEPRSPFSCHWQQSYSVLRNSQIKNLPSPATGGGRLLVLCSFVSSLSLRSRYFATHR